MALELLALTDPSAEGTPTFESIRIYHRQGTRWIAATTPGKGSIPQQLATADSRIAEVMAQMDAPNPAGYLQGFKNLANPLYGRIVSTELDRIIQAAAVPDEQGAPPVLRLHLGLGLDAIPWELLHDGTDFLGLRFQVARLPLVTGGPAAEATAPYPVARVVSLLAKNLLDKPQRGRWRDTFDGTFGAGTTVVRLPADGADDYPELGTLGDPSGDIVHVMCHGVQRGTERLWTLDHQRVQDMNVELFPVDADTTFKTRRTAPLVFANACASMVAAPAAGLIGFAALGEGFGTQFYDAGARAFIGTFAPVTKTVAIDFATMFFGLLLGNGGLPVGEALLKTKEAFRTKGVADPSWLFYCLYGEAGTRFVPA